MASDAPQPADIDTDDRAPRYDVFLAHASPDKDDVERIARRLHEEEKLKPFLDRWHLIPGNDWIDELGESLDASRCCAVFFGPDGLGPWENEEVRDALTRRDRDRGFRVIPVLLPGAVMPDRGKLPLFLNRLHWVDFRGRLDDPRAFYLLVCGIRGVAPGPEAPPEIQDPGICPYLGLRTFQEEDAPFFFGRDALTQWLVEKLRDQRFLAVLGPSGSGKSSAVRAGLIPALRGAALPGSEHWQMLVMVPTGSPLTELAARLAGWCGADLLDLQDRLAQDPRRLHATAYQQLLNSDPAARLLVVVDQFEELYTLRPGDERQQAAFDRERQAFLDNLLYATTVTAGRVVVVVAMRADFYARTAQHSQLADCMAANQVLVTPMAENELTAAIVEPARKVGLDFDEGLVGTIRADVLDQPGALPLLEHALKELWERRQNRRLGLQAYRDIGGVGGAIAQRAEAEYDQLKPEQQAMTQRIFLRLVQLGEGAEDTRRRARLSELLTSPGEAAAVEAVVQELSDARLLTTGRDASSGEKLLDVSHEALIRGWPRLREWLNEDRDALRFHRKLGERAEEWRRLGSDDGGLLRGAQLEQAESWADGHANQMNALEREFIAASVVLRQREGETQQRIEQEREEARRRELEHAQAEARAAERLRRLAMGLAVVLLIAVGAAWFAWDRMQIAERQTQEAERQRAAAERQSRITQSRQLASQSSLYREQSLQVSLLLGLEALKISLDHQE